MKPGMTTNRGGVMARPIGHTTFSIILAGMLVGSSDLAAKGVTDDDIIKDQETPQDVVTYGMGPHIQRYSPLDQINTDNVKDLVPIWAFSFGGEKQRGQEAQPVVHNGKIFVTASYSRLFAVDAQTGEELWEYNHRLPKGILPCCDVINRGAVLYDNLVYFGTLDAQLVALDQDTGKVAWKVKTDHYKAGHSITMAPVIAKGMVIVGNAGSEFGAVGWVKAYDAKTGEEIWYRPLIEGHMGYLRGKENGITGETNATWPGDLWKTGGGAPWEQGSYDPELNLVYFGAGNPAPWNAHKRPGDNLYSASMVAIDVDTGKMVWHYQTVPNDSWDFDSSSELLLFDFEKDGKTVKAGAQANKNGYFYVLDRTNGKLLNAFPFVKNITWAKGIDMETERPIETGNRPGNPAAGEKKGEVVFTAPSFLGGKNWNPMAYDPNNRLFYIPANEWGMDIWNEPISYKKGAAYLGAGFNIKPLFDDYIGVLRAIDPSNGEIVWEQKNGAPLWAGVLVTKGGLVFTGTPEGYVKAYDAKSGEELWKFQTGSGVIGSPITWEQDGEQYISVPSGWGGAVPLWGGEVAKRIKTINQGGSLWTFKLHKG